MTLHTMDNPTNKVGACSPRSPNGLRRLGTIMEPVPGNPHEVEGVLNPAAVRGPDGHLYLLPRLVGPGNFSRIGLARVTFNRQGEPSGVQRMGVALAPEAPYELNEAGGGVEDPRVTYLAACRLYMMTYTAYGSTGPRVAGALSRDLLHWRRTGLAHFDPLHGIDLAEHDNKDALLFPDPVPAPDGRPSLALIHRPDFRALRDRTEGDLLPDALRQRPSMWISYAPLEESAARKQVRFGQHHLGICTQAPQNWTADQGDQGSYDGGIQRLAPEGYRDSSESCNFATPPNGRIVTPLKAFRPGLQCYPPPTAVDRSCN